MVERDAQKRLRARLDKADKANDGNPDGSMLNTAMIHRSETTAPWPRTASGIDTSRPHGAGGMPLSGWCGTKQIDPMHSVFSAKGQPAVPFSHPVYARCILDFLNSRGVSVSSTLSSAGLAWQDLCDGRRMDISAFLGFVAQAIHVSGEPALGLMSGLMLQPYHSAAGIAAVTGENLGQGLQFWSRHAKLVFGCVDLRLETGAQWSTLTVKPLRPLYDIHAFVQEFILGAHFRLFEAILGRPVDELEVGLPYARPAGNDVPCLRYARRVEFEQKDLVFRIPARLLLAPCASADPMEFSQAAELCRKMASESGHGDFPRRVRDVLSARLTEDPDAVDVAADLGISARTLAHRLAKVGISYADMKNDLRETLAAWYLQHTEMSMEAIATQLGYAEPANFSRAFKRWHGVAPRTMRQRFLEAS